MIQTVGPPSVGHNSQMQYARLRLHFLRADRTQRRNPTPSAPAMT